MKWVWSLFALEVSAIETISLAQLNIDREGVAIAGFDHSADFAHQFHISFSSLNPINLQECIDAVEEFFRSRIYVFRGSHDDITVHGAVENTVGLLAQMLPDPAQQIKLVNDQPFAHVLPLNSTAHFNSSAPAGYDGPGECLRHVFDAKFLAGASKLSNWVAFDQTEFNDKDSGFQEQGWIYIPDQCKGDAKTLCKLVVRPDTCSPRDGQFAADVDEFAKYAEDNRIVILHPCLGGPVNKTKYPHAPDVANGKLDVYGQLTENYVEQSAPHMRAIGKMLRRVLGAQSSVDVAAASPVVSDSALQATPESYLDAFNSLPWPFPQKLPTLQIKGAVITAGCSNTADFASQLHVAFSSLVTSSCIFSGMPFHCAATRFPDDYLVAKSKSTAAGIHCDGCPENGTLIYDHCKNHPKWVDIDMLGKYAETADNVDDPRVHLADARVFSFGPTHDRCYQPPAMENVANFHLRYAKNSSQVKLVEDQPFPHTLPTNSTPYYNHSDPAGYDGPGECLRHVIGHDKPLQWAVPSYDASLWHVRDVSEFVHDYGVGMWPWVWLMVPPQCESGACHLLVLPGACGPTKALGGPGGSDEDFARYAVVNDIVILKTCQGSPLIDRNRFPDNHENVRGMVDVYGQLSAEYATQKGGQMEPIGKMLKRLIGVEHAVYV